jgi:uncharacterized protein
MIEHWHWAISGIALASIPLLHWLLFGRSLSVSGRISALVNRTRFGGEAPAVEMSSDELISAVREATIKAFGAAAMLGPTQEHPNPALPNRLPMSNHLLFLGGIVGGGLLSALAAGAYSPEFTLHGATFNGLFGGSAIATAAVLIGGGILVGFGTRMAAGCTTGHGLCGVSRFQKGSLAATGAFFGTAIVVSLGLGLLS